MQQRSAHGPGRVQTQGLRDATGKDRKDGKDGKDLDRKRSGSQTSRDGGDRRDLRLENLRDVFRISATSSGDCASIRWPAQHGHVQKWSPSIRAECSRSPPNQTCGFRFHVLETQQPSNSSRRPRIQLHAPRSPWRGGKSSPDTRFRARSFSGSSRAKGPTGDSLTKDVQLRGLRVFGICVKSRRRASLLQRRMA